MSNNTLPQKAMDDKAFDKKTSDIFASVKQRNEDIQLVTLDAFRDYIATKGRAGRLQTILDGLEDAGGVDTKCWSQFCQHHVNIKITSKDGKSVIAKKGKDKAKRLSRGNINMWHRFAPTPTVSNLTIEAMLSMVAKAAEGKDSKTKKITPLVQETAGKILEAIKPIVDEATTKEATLKA